MVESGAVLHGKYRIEQVLGKGGMGVVARALHVDLDKPVALKLLRRDVLQNQNAVERFRREARAMGQLTSEHVCRVFDVGMLDDGVHYMVMEYLEGKDLGLILREQKRLTPGLAVDLVLQACEALAEAHALGIVHRDIKPANCFLTRGPDGEPLLKVLDFGIAKALDGADDGITTSQSIIGSPSYMSPEQMRSSKHVDARTDIWALGVVLYELVSGRRPFPSDHFAGVCLAVTTTPMLPLDDVALPDGLAEIIARCLAKQPDERIGSMAELSAALAPYAGTSAQGERSSVRTARILERASSPALALSGMGTTVAGTRRRGGGTRSTAHEPGLEPTVTASAQAPTVTASARAPTSTTGRTTRPLPATPRPGRRPRRRWLLGMAGLALFALILVIGVVRGTSQWPGPTESWGDHGQEAGLPAASGEAALPAASGEAALPAASGEAAMPPGAPLDAGREVQGAAGTAADRAPDAEPVPAVTGELSPAARGQTASPGQASADSAARSAQPGTARPARRRGVQGAGRRSSADARPVTSRERPMPAPARAVQPETAPVTRDTLINDEALTSQH
jgi:tRNA A-37 threonylcarbamoyl transferase component Bud32